MKKTKDLIGPPSIGEVVEGKIIARGQSSVFVDLGFMGTGVVYGREYQKAKDSLKDYKIGDTIAAKIIGLENEEGYRELSLKEAEKESAWQELKELKEKGKSVKVKILGANKGGLLTSLRGIKAFLPVSQLSPEHYPRVEEGDKREILKKLQEFIGKELEVKILDLSFKEEKLILSEKAQAKEEAKEILKDYKEGDIIEGEISGIAEFGAFIKFPLKSAKKQKETPAQIEGLCHISELDWQLIEDPSDVVKLGDVVKAKIIKIDENNQVFLSLKQLKKNPWAEVENKYKKGDIVKGKVTKFNPFGAFVQLTPKIQGLCHISEFGSQKKMEESLEIGKEYNFKILSVEPAEHRITLKLEEK